ncbi:hypothetical protein VNI00_004222 [Paramarasmius palmivorus]|uniref:Uncharacterized protein n=1 Tax=Paramarasmius palmivorus TaxID=297713 RepID=A0AAW0DR96_9AGAR
MSDSSVSAVNRLGDVQLDENVKVKPWQGLVGAFLGPTSEIFLTSPNTTVLYEPPLSTRTVRRRKDYRFAQDDPLLWPQRFFEDRCHYSVIRRPPEDPSDPLCDWWEDPNDVPFNAEEGVLTGVGKLHHPYVLRHLNDIEDINKRFDAHAVSTTHSKPNKYAAVLKYHLNRNYRVLTDLAHTCHEARCVYSFMQRCYIELVAALDWVEVYQPRMEGRLPSWNGHADAKKLMGAFVVDEKSATHLFNAGIPVWVVRERRYHSSTLIMKDAAVTTPSGYASFEPMDSEDPVYVGADVMEKIKALEKYTSRGIQWGDPFKSAQLTTAPVATLLPQKRPGGRTTQAPPKRKKDTCGQDPVRKPKMAGAVNEPAVGSTSVLSPGIRSNRDKFEVFVSDFAPPTPDAWAAGLSKVNRSQPRRQAVAGYVLPEMGLFLNVPATKRNKYLASWLKYRSALIFRANDASQPPPLWRAQLWRMLLALEITGNAALDTHTDGITHEEGEISEPAKTTTQKQRDIVHEALGTCIRRSGVAINESVVARSDIQFEWRGRPRRMSDLDDPQLVRDILCELAQLSFRFELLSLDRARCAARGDSKDLELDRALREEKVQKCFTADNQDSCARGLAAVNIRDRGPYLLNLQHVMREWKGAGNQQWLTVPPRSLELYTDGELERLERRIAIFYTQLFYDEYGRACTLPHRPT